jgi:gp16 family phage-associated protein
MYSFNGGVVSNITLERKKQVAETLSRRGLSLGAWCKLNGVSPNLVRDLINGRNSGRINKGHKVAVLLGIKDGEITGN